MSEALSPELPPTPRRGLSRALVLDLGTSYLVSLTRIGAMATALGYLYRHADPAYVAVFVATRSAASFLTHLFAGIGPTRLRALAAEDQQASIPAAEVFVDERERGAPLDYAGADIVQATDATPTAQLRHLRGVNALLIVIAVLASGFAAATLPVGDAWTDRPETVSTFIFLFGLGTIARLSSDAAGARLQHRGRMWLDNAMIAAGECAFIAIVASSAKTSHSEALHHVGATFVSTGFVIAAARTIAAFLMRDSTSARPMPLLDRRYGARSFGVAAGSVLLISLAQLGDLLYGPANNLIIGYVLDARDLAAYGPLLQIDGGLLLLVGAVAAIVLPRTTRAATAGDVGRVRSIYIRATLGSLALLLLAALLVALFRRPLLTAWLGDPQPLTLRLLPLVLIHTVIGGTAGVGRAVMLGMGRFKAYTISAIFGGLANVVLALIFVLGLGWGLRGIVMATILAVTIRCAIWMPWYILRSLRPRA